MPAKSDVIQTLAERYRTRSNTVVERPESVYEWASRYRRIDGQPFSLARFQALQALYEDDWPRLVVMKPAQRGVSEWAISLTFYALECGAQVWVPDGSKNGINVGYIFPARGDLIEFSKERISGLKDESTHMASLFNNDEYDSLSFKQVGNSFLYLRGGYSDAGLRSFPCDLLILDEYDELDPGAVSLARRRLNASVVRREIRISTPTVPGRGISAAYAASDQRVYQTECLDCEEWNSYDFFRDVWVGGEPFEEWTKWTQAKVEASPVELRCPNCHKPQSIEARCKVGRWVAMNPEITRVHGYHIPWWPWEFLELEQLATSAVSPEPKEVEQLYHSDLGLPYGAGGGGITDDMLMQLSTLLPDGKLPTDATWRDTCLGADIGGRIHFSVDSVGPGDQVYVREMGSVSGWEELKNVIDRYQVRHAVVDAEPEILSALQFCERPEWRGRVKRCFYPTAANALKGTMYQHKEGTLDIIANRTMLLDQVYANIAAALERWPLSLVTDQQVTAHLKNQVRTQVTDEETGKVAYSWVRTGPDHLLHARAYATLARKLLPRAVAGAPAVGGSRPVIEDHARMAAAVDLGRLNGAGQSLPSWIPPAVR